MASLALLNAPILRQPQSLLSCSWVTQKTKPSLTSCRTHSEERNHGMMNRCKSPDYVRILDTTLRDGEQSPGVALSLGEKLEIAKQLAKLRVDVIDAGFPATSPQEAEAVRRIAEDVGGAEDAPIITAFARSIKSDIAAAWEAVRGAKRPRILTFISTSDIHARYKLNKSLEEVLAIAVEMVAYARSLGCQDIQFGAEDAGRTRLEFLCDVFEGVIAAGASTVGIGDTVGYLFPAELANIVTNVKENTRGIEQAVISCHCHNDLGLATSNTLAGALAGARQLEVSINGIGERAGNASLEEVVMAMKCRRKDVMQGLYTGIDTRHIFLTSQMVAEYTGMLVQPNKAIVGANAFSHESGIHQDGMLKHRGTYEILRPSDIGIIKTDEDSIVLGKHSGRHALNARLAQLGHKLNSENLDEVFKRFKVVAEEKKIVTNLDLEVLVGSRRENGAPTR